MIEIELLYFEGCPSWERAWSELGQALAQSDADATVRLRNVASLPPAQMRGFAGSPTIRIDGQDLEDYAGESAQACRRYPGNGGRGWPSAEQIRARLQGAEGNST